MCGMCTCAMLEDQGKEIHNRAVYTSRNAASAKVWSGGVVVATGKTLTSGTTTSMSLCALGVRMRRHDTSSGSIKITRRWCMRCALSTICLLHSCVRAFLSSSLYKFCASASGNYIWAACMCARGRQLQKCVWECVQTQTPFRTRSEHDALLCKCDWWWWRWWWWWWWLRNLWDSLVA